MTDTRRRYERIETKLPCRLFIPDDDPEEELRFEAFVASGNLGLGGVFVESTFLLKPGLGLLVDLGLPNATLTIGGRVVHVVGHDDSVYPTGMGIEFVDMDARGREVLMRDFAPMRYREFHEALLDEMPHLERTFALGDVALLINLWEEWKIVREGGPLATASGAPEPTPRVR